MGTPTKPRPNILVVDDTRANLRLLISMLEDHGYRGRPVTNGPHALEAVKAERPDLILLDVSMPEMDGYEVCRQLKANPLSAEIPIIFISALTEAEDKIKGLDAGAVDYIAKPFRVSEVLARVRTHLQLQRQQQDLKESHAKLRELEHLRDQLTHMIAHDMRSPLMAINMSLQVAKMGRTNSDDTILDGAQQEVRRLIEMVSQMLDVSRLEAQAMQLKLEHFSMGELAQSALGSLSTLASTLSIKVECSEPCILSADRELIRRVIANFLGNAIKFANDKILLKIQQETTQIRVEISDDGPGISREHHDRIFEKFGQVNGPRLWLGSGLGLTFAKMAIEAHGGNVGVISEVGHGSTFWFVLPTNADHSTT